MSSGAPANLTEGHKPHAHAEAPSPVIVDLGRRNRSAIRQLCRGEGQLVTEVQGCIEELQSSGAVSATAQPVVIIVRERRKARRLLWPSLGL
jgi:hypothetical protein